MWCIHECTLQGDSCCSEPACYVINPAVVKVEIQATMVNAQQGAGADESGQMAMQLLPAAECC